MSSARRQILLRLLVPLATVAAAAGLTLSLHTFRINAPLFVFLTAVLISAWVGGWMSGLLATALVIAARYLLPPANALLISGSDEVLRWTMFVLIAVMVSSL